MKKGLYVLLAIAFLGCSDFQKVMKDPSLDARYEAGLAYYKAEDYYKAGLLFEDLLPQLIGTKRAQDVQFYYAYTHFHQRQFELAHYYFNSFYDTYPRSKRAEEAYFMKANSLYFSTPAYNLDQSNTDDAMQAFQDFLNRYPESEGYRQIAEARIRELQKKLEKKYYSIANQYYKLRLYKSAVSAFRNFTRDFPDTDLKEEARFMELKSAYFLAEKSFTKVKEERYQTVFDLYLTFVTNFPESPFLKEAGRYYESARADLVKTREQLAMFDSLQQGS